MPAQRDATQEVIRSATGGQAAQAASAIDLVSKPLLQTLADLAADKNNLSFQPFDEAKNRTVTSFGWDWSLGAKSDSTMSIDVLDAQEAAARGLQPPDGQVVASYKWDSSLDAKTSGNQDAGPWKLAADADASLKAALEWLYSGGNNETLASAIVNAGTALVSHTDLPALMRLCTDSTHFWGATATLDGTLQATLHAEASSTATGWTYGFDKDRPTIGFSVSAAGSVALKLAGSYRLAAVPVKRQGVWGLQVSLDRDSRSDRSLAIDIDAGIDFSALAASAEKFVRANLPDAQPLSDRLDLLTQPGTFLRGEIQERLGQRFANQPELVQLALLVMGKGNEAEVASALAGRVTAPLTDVLDRITGDINMQSADKVKATNDWIDRAFGDTKIADAAVKQLQVTVDQCIQSIVQKADRAIEDLAAQLKGKTTDEAAKVLAPFGRLGDTINAQLAKVGGAIADATQPIRDAIKLYSDKRNAILAALQDAARAKVTAAIAISVQQTDKESQLFRAWFAPGTDGVVPESAQRLYQALCSGRLASLDRLVAEAQKDRCILDVESWLLRAAERIHAEGVTVNLLGWEFSDRKTSLTDVSVKASGGYVVAASGKADLDAQVSNYWIARETELAITVKLAGDPALAPTAIFAFSGAFSAKGRDLDRDYIRSMEDSLAVMCGPGLGEVERLVRQATGAAFPGDRFWRDIAVLLPMDLDQGEWRTFLGRDEASIRRTCAGFGMQALDAVYDGKSEFGNMRPSALLLEKSADTVDQPRMSGEEQVAAYLQRYAEGQFINAFEFPGTDRLVAWGYGPNADWSRVVRQVRIINRFAQIAHGLVRISRSSRTIAEIVSRSHGMAPDRVFAAIRSELGAIADAIAPAAVASMTFTAKGERNVPWPLVTFAATIAQMAGRKVPPGFIPMVSLPGNATPIPLLG